MYIEFNLSFYQHKETYLQKLKKKVEDSDDWKASKWLLEKADAESYGDKQEINVNHKAVQTGGAIVIPVLGQNVTEEEMNKLLAESQNNLQKDINKIGKK